MIGFYMVWGVNGGKTFLGVGEKKSLFTALSAVTVFYLANFSWPITQPISKSCTILAGTTCTVHAFSMDYPV